jgi:N-acetylglucosamine-6-phosphate deacetylase
MQLSLRRPAAVKRALLCYPRAVAAEVFSGRILTPEGARPGSVSVEGGRIRALGAPAAGGRTAAWVAPGFIDLQVNGGFGIDLAGEPERVGELARRLPATGVTAFLPTLISAPADQFEAWAERIAAAGAVGGARVLGLHLEGPFLSPERPGAHDASIIAAADAACFERMLALPALRLATLAPERPDALARIARLVARGVVVSLGHTAADLEQMRAGIDAGARLVTHLYNAMTGFSHRAPGALGAALVDPRVALGLIADGVHAHPVAVELAARAAGPGRIALVTDAMAAAGMGPGRAQLAGRTVEVDAVSARLPDGTLAGSILTLDQAVRNAAAWSGLGAEAALRMASEVPARALGLAAGALAVGAPADLVLLDDDLRIEATYVAGQLVYQRAA